VATHKSGKIVRGPGRRIARLLAAAIAVVLALLLRVALDRYSITLPTYITFYPAVFLAAVLGGMWEGILATALSALMADYFLLPPVGQFSVHSTSDIVSLAIFCVSGVTVSIVAELVQGNRGKLEAYRFKEAVRSERRKVEEAQDLPESILEERLRFLGVLKSLRGMDGSTECTEVDPIGRESGADGQRSSLDEGKFKASLRRTVMVPFMAALMIAGAALWAAYDLNASMKSVDHTDQVIGESRRLLKLTVDMETGERGYLVTGNDAFLQPYDEASKVVDSEYQSLYNMVADNPAQQTRLDRLHESLIHWQSYAAQMIALRRTGGAYADLKINLAGKGEVDEIRDQIAGFQSVEEHLREERNRTAHRDWRLVETICILLGLVVGSALAIFTFRRVEIIAETFDKSRRALEESERRWAITLASIGDAVIATDHQGRVTFLNPVASALTGWRSEDALGRPIQEVFHIVNEQTRVPAEDIVDRVLKEGRTFELANHTALLRKDGREIPIADSAAPIMESKGRIVGVVLVFHDVTENRRAEEALRESRAKLEAALASMTDSVIITDAAGKFVEFNDAFAAFYRFKSKEECAKNFDEFASIFDVFLPSGEAAPREMWAIQRALRGETATGAEYTVQRKDTGEAWIGSLSFSPIRDEDGAIIGSVITARDITEAKQAEEERQIAIDFLGMVNQSQGTKDLLERAATFFQRRSGCEAVGIRLREGEDFPYFEARGFSNEFVHLESKLCVRTASGKALRDSAGKVQLECLCGNVIRGQFESSKPFYTAHGSFWSNSSTELIASAKKGDLPAGARHRCNRAGYESVALFPIYVGEERFGLVQLNDRRKGRFSAQSVVLWERLAGHLATAVSKFQAEEALQESEKRYRNLFNSMNEGFCVIEVLFDADGKPEDYRFIEVNDAFEKQTGLHDAVGKRMRELAPDHEEHWFEIYGRIAMTGEAEHFINEAKALNRYYDVHAYRVGEPEMRRVAIVFTDFSNYKRAEEALRESEELLGLFAEHAPAALAMFDNKMRYLHASRRWRADYGLGDRDLNRVSHYDVFPEIPEEWREAHRRGLAGEVLRGDADRFERADGSEQWIRWEVRPWCRADGKVGGIVIFSEEITERKKAQEALLRSEKEAFQRQQLRALADRMRQVREEERKTVARDLHDQIGQILTAIKMDMAWAVRHLPKSEDEVHRRLTGSIEMINDGVHSVRKICSGLRPGILDDLGLAAAIDWQANEFGSRTGIRCKVTLPPAELRLDGDRSTAIFRIFQECLTNVARHAEAQSVSASLTTQDEELLLVVQDDGKGFRASEAAGSLGVLGMKERAKACGGDVQVSSSPGKGTTVTVRVPVRAAGVEREDNAYSDSR
jgi:PAS domain S-box-containing protein